MKYWQHHNFLLSTRCKHPGGALHKIRERVSQFFIVPVETGVVSGEGKDP